jgi:hypothetical protein
MKTKLKKTRKHTLKNKNMLQINLNQTLYQEIQAVNFVFGKVNISLNKNGEIIFANDKAKIILQEDGNIKMSSKKNIKLKSKENIYLN